MDPARSGRPRLRRPPAEDRQVLPLPSLGRFVDTGREQPVVVHDHLDVGQFADLPQLGRGEPDVLRRAADQHVHIGDRAGPQRREHRVGDVGTGHLVGRAGQHPGHVQRDVAGADHRDAGPVEQRVETHLVGVSAVPADERTGAEGAVQILPRHTQRPVQRAAGRVHDGVEVLPQRIDRQPALADGHVAEELHVRAGHGPGERLLQHPDHRLHLHVVGRHAVADQPVRGGQPVQHGDAHRHPGSEQRGDGVQPRRAGSDHGHPWLLHLLISRATQLLPRP